VSGCGSSSHPPAAQTVQGPGFTFSAPAGWQLSHGAGRASATHGAELVQVVTFKLVRPYSDKLFAAVEKELTARMRAIVQQTDGKLVSATTVSPAGIRSHSYRVEVGDHVDEYIFVLRGSREYQLLCRRSSSSSTDFCGQLVKTFAVS